MKAQVILLLSMFYAAPVLSRPYTCPYCCYCCPYPYCHLACSSERSDTTPKCKCADGKPCCCCDGENCECGTDGCKCDGCCGCCGCGVCGCGGLSYVDDDANWKKCYEHNIWIQ
ncbi:Metallothionein, putative [Pediculus humanus corporis]|uniref:Metallothionein, putative n=1 Tax=Pediculus humanus subsp. corporis TaxID=121224 RepID=E0VIB3_PEDHC|nr:Metallothionein, putative [Pediculus humanus corporis]EEB13119.1 Metallothionein, putative [Pediculus humanus corporis]